MSKVSDKIQAAIFRIDLSAFEGETFHEVIPQIITSINKGLSRENRYKAEDLSFNKIDGFDLALFYADRKSIPRWVPFLQPILGKDAVLPSVQNHVYSYISFIGYNNQLFALTGGNGSLAIDKYIEQEFGMEILVRLFQEQSKVIKSIQERAFTGIVLGQTKFYRGDQRFADENKFGTIYKQVQAELNKNLLTTIFGFKQEELRRKVAGCLAKSSFTISKAVDLKTVLQLVKRFTEILLLDRNFSLNKVTLISKRNNKTEKLRDALLGKLQHDLFLSCQNSTSADFDFCHREFDKFLTASGYAIVLDSEKKIELNDGISLDEIIKRLEQDGSLLSNDVYEFKCSVLDRTLEAVDDEGARLTIGTIMDHIHGEIQYNNQTYFFLDGEWYQIDGDFIKDINKECQELLENYWDESLLTEAFDLAKRESDFNCQFLGQPNCFVFDTITPEHIEACDVLKHDDNAVYLLHVKKGFNNSIRDLAAQVSIAARRIKMDRLNEYKYISLLEDQTKAALFSNSDFKKRLGKQTFPIGGLKDVFLNKKDRQIVFCLAFVDVADTHRSLKNDLHKFDSNIAKFALIQLRREVIGLGFDFRIVQLAKTTKKLINKAATAA